MLGSQKIEKLNFGLFLDQKEAQRGYKSRYFEKTTIAPSYISPETNKSKKNFKYD